MEREVGERFDYNGTTLEVVEATMGHHLYPCCDCYFLLICSCYKYMYITGKCGNRDDKREVYFKEVKNENRTT